MMSDRYPLRRRSILLPVAASLLLLVGCSPFGDAEASENVRVLPYALEKPDFTFTDTEGRPFDFRRETEGYVTLLFFGFTNCPDICPIQMANIGAVLRDLPAETASRIKVVFVSTDPARDTPERLRNWLGAIHPSFIGLIGPLDEVNEAEQALLLPRSVVQAPEHGGEHDDEEDYFVGHASAVVAFGADGLAWHMYLFGTRQQDWRRDLPRLVAEGRRAQGG